MFNYMIMVMLRIKQVREEVPFSRLTAFVVRAIPCSNHLHPPCSPRTERCGERERDIVREAERDTEEVSEGDSGE